jgi:hypothetical protein
MTDLSHLSVGAAGALVAVLVGIVAAIRRAWPWVRKLVTFANAIIGEPPEDIPPGQTPRAGVLARLAAVEDEARKAGAAAIEAATHAQRAADAAQRAALAAEDAARQLHPNGGTSARDQLDQIFEAVRPTEPEEQP